MLVRRIRGIRADLSVGQKLAVGFGLVGLISISLVLATFGAISRLDRANLAEDRALSQVSAATQVQHRAAVLRAEQLSYVAAGDAVRVNYEAAAVAFEIALDELRGTARTPTEIALVSKLSTGYQSFLAIDHFVWEATLEGKSMRAHYLVLGASALDFGFMAADAELFVLGAQQVQKQKSIEFVETRDQTRVIVAALGLLALTLVAGASRGIARLIRDPLLELQRAAVQAAEGDLEAEVPVHGKDEIGSLATAFNSMLLQLGGREARLIEQHDRGELTRKIDVALEMAEDDEAVYKFASRALEEIAPERATEILLADNPRSDLSQQVVAGPMPEGPSCQVTSPQSCPAVRSNTAMTFEDSEALDSCLYLNGRPSGPCSAVCVPLSFMGRSAGVLHSTGPHKQQISTRTAEELAMLSGAAGTRIGILRSTARTQLHATTDGLTGLFNRRTFESKARTMHERGERFTLVMADLDHFKLLNDEHGHDAGDRALRVFAQVLAETVREQDIVSRWGGEEFTIALVGSSLEQAAKTLDRLRVELVGRIATSNVAPFTASYGYVDAGNCESFDAVLRCADGALYQAKSAGRNRAAAADVDPLTARVPVAFDDPDEDEDVDLLSPLGG